MLCGAWTQAPAVEFLQFTTSDDHTIFLRMLIALEGGSTLGPWVGDNIQSLLASNLCLL
jgi:hypothetical protein